MSDPVKLYSAAAGTEAEIAADEALTNAELRATAVPVSGTVSVGNLPATQPVSGSVSVSNFPATQPVSGTVAVSSTPDPEYTHVVATVTASGDTTIHTPGSGLAVRLRSVTVSTEPGGATPPVVSVKLGATEVFRTYDGALTQRVTGAANAALVIGLSGAGSVAVTAVLQEV